MSIFEILESNVRSYCRNFPETFHKAKGAVLYSEAGKEYIDFLAGAGALNYGHNPDFIKSRILSYIESDGITQGLDFHTKAKKEFLEKFSEVILKPRKLNYKIQFCGPTGANAVEAALKLARKLKKRTGIFSFMGGFHGMTVGSLSVTGHSDYRSGAGIPLNHVTFLPYPDGSEPTFNTLKHIEMLLGDTHSGIEKPAALILETVQAEGGVRVAPDHWLGELEKLCIKHDILLICDDIQVGCWRTGTFLSFEKAAIVPDMVILSKSISGYGLPMSILLMKPELDIWQPGEHSGTFRGNQLAFIGGTAALDYALGSNLKEEIQVKENFLQNFLLQKIVPLHSNIQIRGKGMIWGIDFSRVGDSLCAEKVSSLSFKAGLIVERVGRNDSVIKLLPPLTIEMDVLKKGCSLLEKSVAEALKKTL